MAYWDGILAGVGQFRGRQPACRGRATCYLQSDVPVLAVLCLCGFNVLIGTALSRAVTCRRWNAYWQCEQATRRWSRFQLTRIYGPM
jgi:hypothetical protein